MKIKVGGCYGSEEDGKHSVGFLVNGKLLLEGGTVTSAFSAREQSSIGDVLISHIHLDHTKELLFLVDRLSARKAKGVIVHAVREVVEGLKKSLFNDLVWPDFSRLPEKDRPVLKYRTIPLDRYSTVGGLRVKPVLVTHPVPTTGFILSDTGGSVLYTGDTGPTFRIWEAARGVRDLAAVFAETSFPNEKEKLALESGHLTPRLLETQLELLARLEVPIYVFHMKPMFLGRISDQLKRIKGFKVRMVRQNFTYTF